MRWARFSVWQLYIVAFSKWFDLPHQLRPRFQKLVFPAGYLLDRENGFGTTELGYIYELNRRSITQKTTLVDFSGFDWNLVFAELQEWSQLRDEMNTYATTLSPVASTA